MHNASLLFKPFNMKLTSIVSLFKTTLYLFEDSPQQYILFFLSPSVLFTVTKKARIKEN